MRISKKKIVLVGMGLKQVQNQTVQYIGYIINIYVVGLT